MRARCLWIGAVVLSSALVACAGQVQPAPVTHTITVTQPAASTPAADTPAASEPAPPADVTYEDLRTAISPQACSPSQRMIDGRVPGDVPYSEVVLEPGSGSSPVFLDMAGLGYRQGLAIFECGGASPVPYYLMLTGAGGELLGQLWLGDFEPADKSYVTSMTVEGDTVVIEWSVAQVAGGYPTAHLSRVSFHDGQLMLQEIIEPNVLGVPLSRVIRPNGDASFVSPTGKLLCRVGARVAGCQGMSLLSAPDSPEYCRFGVIEGPTVVEGQVGWSCVSQQTMFPTTDQQWWQGHGFPTVDSRIAGPGAAVLPYGWVVQSATMACRSESDGMTCMHVHTGTGFHGNDSVVTMTGPYATHQGEFGR